MRTPFGLMTTATSDESKTSVGRRILRTKGRNAEARAHAAHRRYRGVKAVVAIIVGPLLDVTLAAAGRWMMLATTGQ